MWVCQALYILSPQNTWNLKHILEKWMTFLKIKATWFDIFQLGLIKIRASVHFLCDTVLRTLLHISPQFQREMFTEWR